MRLDLSKIVGSKYKKAGFVCVKNDENCDIFKNKFSIHYVFYCGSLNEAKERAPDLYWNFYAILLIEIETADDEFTKFRETIQRDFRICRKYVLSDKDLDSLPPSFIEIGSKPDIEQSVWEQGWREMVGAQLYDAIMQHAKSHIGKVFAEYIDDKTN